jgi:hypothetical protein
LAERAAITSMAGTKWVVEGLVDEDGGLAGLAMGGSGFHEVTSGRLVEGGQ